VSLTVNAAHWIETQLPEGRPRQWLRPRWCQ